MSNRLFEGIGAPVDVPKEDGAPIDPTLDSCCQREVSTSSDGDEWVHHPSVLTPGSLVWSVCCWCGDIIGIGVMILGGKRMRHAFTPWRLTLLLHVRH